METNIVATIDGTGIAEAKNDLATFTLTLRSKDENLETAKRQLGAKTSQVVRELEDMKLNLHSAITQDMANFKLEHREGGEKYSAGYTSVNTITFTVNIDEHLNSIYKHCSKIDQHMSGPWFSIKEIENLKSQALQKATDDANKRLDKECELLGVSRSALKIHNWNFAYDGNLPAKVAVGQGYAYGIAGATGPQGSQGPTSNYLANNYNGFVAPAATKLGSIYQEPLDFNLNPGSVAVKIAVRVNYIWNQ